MTGGLTLKVYRRKQSTGTTLEGRIPAWPFIVQVEDSEGRFVDRAELLLEISFTKAFMWPMSENVKGAIGRSVLRAEP